MARPQLTRIEVQGFRSFGTVRQTPDLPNSIAVFWGGNSQGKTSFSEALEFLFSGQIARRDLLASAKDEFTEALRNVHLSPTDVVSVEAHVTCPDGRIRKLHRTLTEDYKRGNPQGCVSTLTVDGSPCNDNELSTLLGIRLSQHPVRAPILGQHNLAYLFSASPTDRAAYFRAVLDTQDLEDFRTEVAALESGLVAPVLPELADLDEVELAFLPMAASRQLRESASSEILQSRLATVAETLLKGIGATVPQGLSVLADAIETELITRRSKTFPVALFSRSAFVSWPDGSSALVDAANRFLGERQKVDADTQRTLGLFRAALTMPPHKHGGGRESDCPLCGAADTFTDARVAFIREQVRASEAYLSASETFLAATRSAIGHCDNLTHTLRGALPRFMREPSHARRRAGFTVERIKALLPSDDTRVAEWLSSVRRLARADRKLQSRLMRVRTLLDEILTDIDSWSNVVGLSEALHDLAEAQQKFADQLSSYEGPARSLGQAINTVIDQGAKTNGWEQLIRFARDPASLWRALVTWRAYEHKTKAVQKAVRDIDAAIGRVTDEKFAELSGEVKLWWDRLRPEENTFFSGVQRRSEKTRRTVDLKAGMSVTEDRANPKIRDAVAVFSQSQLHCLGLSLFLAKAVQEQAGFIVLDDPVLTSDEDYRPNFTSSVLEALLDHGIQVIICTQDHRTWKDIGDRWQHRNATQYHMVRNNAVLGTEIRQENDDLETMIAKAGPNARAQDPDVRKEGARQIREIMERFAKRLLCRHRKANGDNAASITDYDGKDFGTYANAVYALLTKDPADAGKLKSGFRDVTPGPHDDTPPMKGVLARALSDVRKLKREYLD